MLVSLHRRNSRAMHCRYETWGEIECTYLVKHLGKPLNDTSMVCRRHLLEAKRCHHKPDHVPSWKTEEAVSDLGSSHVSFPPAKVCSNPKCENSIQDKLIKPMFTTCNKLAELFNTEYTGGPFALCRQCYYNLCGSSVVLVVLKLRDPRQDSSSGDNDDDDDNVTGDINDSGSSSEELETELVTDEFTFDPSIIL